VLKIIRRINNKLKLLRKLNQTLKIREGALARVVKRLNSLVNFFKVDILLMNSLRWMKFTGPFHHYNIPNNLMF